MTSEILDSKFINIRNSQNSQNSLPVRPGRLREGLLWRQQGQQFGGVGGIAQPEH